MDFSAKKSNFRKELRVVRREFVSSLEPFDRDGAFLTFPRLVHPLIAQAKTVGLYAANRYEAPTAALFNFLIDSRRQTAMPWFAAREAPMLFLLWKPGEPLHPGPFGIAQPDHTAESCVPDLLIVPLTGFDDALNRLGQGGGHYDRWLEAHPATKTIGLAWSAQQVDALPHEPHDRPLDAIITEREAFMRGVTS